MFFVVVFRHTGESKYGSNASSLGWLFLDTAAKVSKAVTLVFVCLFVVVVVFRHTGESKYGSKR